MQTNVNETANPAPLGLTGFGLATILLNLHNAGLFPLDTMVLAMGIFLGGIVQTIVGVIEWKKNNLFGMMAFSSYGFFWLSLVALILLPKLGLGTAATPYTMGFYLTVWGIFSFGMFYATLKMANSMKILFFSVVLLFGLLALADFTGSHIIKIVAGIEGIFCGGFALYLAMAEVINHVHGKTVLAK